jgi:hypothetical protein
MEFPKYTMTNKLVVIDMKTFHKQLLYFQLFGKNDESIQFVESTSGFNKKKKHLEI